MLLFSSWVMRLTLQVGIPEIFPFFRQFPQALMVEILDSGGVSQCPRSQGTHWFTRKFKLI